MGRSPFIFAHDPTNFHGGDTRAEPGTMPVQNRVPCPCRTGYHAREEPGTTSACSVFE